MDKRQPKKGAARLISAFRYSLQGLGACFRSEEAFRQEVSLFFLLLPVIVLVPAAPLLKLMLFGVNCLVLIVELLNSAIETIVDKVSPDYNELAGRAKDLGSAAVLLSLIAAAAVWAYAIFQIFFN